LVSGVIKVMGSLIPSDGKVSFLQLYTKIKITKAKPAIKRDE
jgi:hypothetical protein